MELAWLAHSIHFAVPSRLRDQVPETGGAEANIARARKRIGDDGALPVEGKVLDSLYAQSKRRNQRA